jgi:hypothetical protein
VGSIVVVWITETFDMVWLFCLAMDRRKQCVLNGSVALSTNNLTHFWDALATLVDGATARQYSIVTSVVIANSQRPRSSLSSPQELAAKSWHEKSLAELPDGEPPPVGHTLLISSPTNRGPT